jgi:hypothetical protein
MERKTKVVNFYGGPGAGKSTTAASVFSLLKLHGVNAELVTEIAKDFTWEQRLKTLENQYYVWAKQQHRLWRVRGEVDVIVTDCPLLLSFIYGERKPECFYDLVLHDFNEYENMNFFIQRNKPFNPKGRNHNEKESKELDVKIKGMLEYLKIRYGVIFGDYEGVNFATLEVLNNLKIKPKIELK